MSSNAEQALRSVIGRFNVKQVVGTPSIRSAQRKALRAALAWAYTVSARDYYPRWASYLMDPEFQALGAGHLQECYLKGVSCLNPAELAGFWADQIGWVNEAVKQRHVAELVPVAARFLRSLEAELCRDPQFQARVDCPTA